MGDSILRCLELRIPPLLVLASAMAGVRAFRRAGTTTIPLAPEERFLAAKFSASYRDYCAQVHGWL